jgi:hypothetical protein
MSTIFHSALESTVARRAHAVAVNVMANAAANLAAWRKRVRCGWAGVGVGVVIGTLAGVFRKRG